MKFNILLLLMSAVCLSCVRESLDDSLTYEVYINACFEDSPTRTVLAEDMGVCWLPEDKVLALSQDGTVSLMSSECGQSATSADFKISKWPRGTDPYYLVAGGSADGPSAQIDGRFVVGNISTVQSISDDYSFGRSSNLAIGQVNKKKDGTKS